MKISDFALKVTKREAKKRQVSIAQILEILRIINRLLKGKLYTHIRQL
jgi:hypothetical protein